MPSLCITQVVSPAAFGGLERVVVGLAEGLASNGHDSHVISIFDAGATVTPLPIGLLTGVTQHVLEIPRRRYDMERSLVGRLCRELDVQVVHTHGYRPDVVDGPGACPRAKYVSTVHGFTGGGVKNRVFEWLQAKAYRRFDAVVPVSRPLCEQLARAGLPAAKLEMIPNGWPGSGQMLAREEARRLLGIRGPDPVIAWVGRLSPEKGPDVFVESLAMLPASPWIAAVLGAGPTKESLRETAARLGIDDRIVWCGSIPNAAAYFRAFDLFVLSSRTEGTPITLFEAMAAKIPIVATTVGGVPDVVDAESAILVPPDSPGALAKAIRDSLGFAAAARARAEVAERRIQTTFRQGAWIARYEGLYARLIK
jgi:glycosyltransferase involved in cell wall biosynthesis